ncbi:MAG TPA: hypothetical protein VK211_25260 [Kamptonema sp.]|nr:hypothetical protein [Kamptonema sp.]
MLNNHKDFCFCTLAFGKKYRELAKQLAADLETHSVGTMLVICTDNPKEFQNCANVFAFKKSREGVDYCYNDKRFALKKALELFRVTIFVDADTRITGKVPEREWISGITCEGFIPILEHPPNQSLPGRKEVIYKLAKKLGLSLEQVSFVQESLFVIARDNGKEIQFIEEWGKIGRFFEVQKVKTKDGNPIGLATTRVGWNIRSDGWQELDQIREHSFAHWDWQKNQVRTFWDKVLDKLHVDHWQYLYRLLKAQLIALLNFNFYYR